MEDAKGMWYTERMRGIERGIDEKCAEQYRGLGIKEKKCLYEGEIVPTALNEAEIWGMRSAERRKVECS